MKTIKIILLLLLISNSLIAQKINIDITFYTKNLGAYEGTWVYQSNDTIFKIVLQKGPIVYPDGVAIDGLLGGYFLSVKGDILETIYLLYLLAGKLLLRQTTYTYGRQTIHPMNKTLIPTA